MHSLVLAQDCKNFTNTSWAMGRVKSFVSGKGGARKVKMQDLLGKKKRRKMSPKRRKTG